MDSLDICGIIGSFGVSILLKESSPTITLPISSVIDGTFISSILISSDLGEAGKSFSSTNVFWSIGNSSSFIEPPYPIGSK